MSNAIATLSYQIGLDTSGFTQGVVATQKEMRALKSVMSDTDNPAERLQTQLAGIEKLRAKFGTAVPEERWQRAIEQVTKEYEQLMAAQQGAAQGKHAPVGPSVTGQIGQELGSRLGGTQLGGLMTAAGPIAAAFVTAELAISGAKAAADLFGKSMQFIGTTALDAIDRLDQIGDSAQALDMSAESLQRLTTAATLADAPAEQLTDALGKMETILGDPSDAQVEIFDKMGLSIEALKKLSPDQAFAKIAASIEAMPDRATQLAAISDIFGKGNKELINLMIGFDKFSADASAFTLTDSQFAAAGEADSAFKQLNMSLEAAANQLGAELAPALADLAKVATDFLGQDSTQSALLTGIVILRDTLREVAALAESVSKMDVFGKAREGLDALGPKGMALGKALDWFTAPFADIAETEKATRELEKKLKEEADKAAKEGAGSADMAPGANKDKADTEKMAKKAAEEEKRRLEHLDEARGRMLQQIAEYDADPMKAMRWRAQDAGARTEEEIAAYIEIEKELKRLKDSEDMLAQAQKARAEEQRKAAADYEKYVDQLKTPMERAMEEMDRAAAAGLDQTQLDQMGGKLADSLLPKGKLSEISGMTKGSQAAIKFELAGKREERQVSLLQQIKDALLQQLKRDPIEVQEATIP